MALRPPPDPLAADDSRQISVRIDQTVLIDMARLCNPLGFSRNEIAGLLIEAGIREIRALYESAGEGAPGILAILRHINGLRGYGNELLNPRTETPSR